tara:strand:- start:3613 stop:5457 length:1845 start_codon:yes stop_codon:yes gene_type:complete
MAQRLNIDIVARDKASKALNGLRGGLAKVRGAVFNLRNAFLGLGAGLVIRNLVNTGRELENLQVRLKFLLKDTNEGAKAFDNMVKFASKVPFSLEEIQSGSGILATVTDNATDLQKMLEITGNVAAVTGLDFRTTAEQIQRSFSAGIGAADLFREKGVRNMLGFQAGAEVSITQTVEAFEKVFGKGGRFGKATDELATTLTGTLSMIGDKAFSFKKTLLDAGFFAELKNQFGSLDKALERNSEQIDRIAIGFGTVLAKSVQGIAGFFKILKDNIDLVITALKLLIAVKIVLFMVSLGKAIMVVLAGLRGIAAVSGVGIPLLAGSVAAVALTFEQMNKEINKVTESMSDAIDKNIEFQNLIKGADANEGFVEPFKEVVHKVKEFEHELSVAVPSATQKAINRFEELNDGAINNMKLQMENIRMTIAEGISSGITKVSDGIARSIILGEKLGNIFQKIAQDAVIRILQGLIEMGLRIAANIVLEKVSEAIARRKNRSQNDLNNGLKTEVALRAMIAAFGGGGGGGGFSLPFFNKGGAVSKGKPVVVGESGAELFIPNQTGQITQSARGTGGGAVNVNFAITTLDATGFQDMLVQNRGTISNIINQAVNERGGNNLV